MLTMNDVKSNDFAYFDAAIEHPQTRSAVKNAFRYIISLSNLASTPIDHWDLEEVFKKEDGWLTDKGKINKAFFERKTAEPAKILNIPANLVTRIEEPLKNMMSGNIRDIKSRITSKTNEIVNGFNSIRIKTRELNSLKQSLVAAEAARKGLESGLLEQINKILRELPVELWNVENSSIEFICTTDTVVPYRDIANGINRSYNLGRLIFKINVEDFSVSCSRRDIINRWCSPSFSHFHMGTYLCHGGFSQDFQLATANTDIFNLVSVLLRWKDTYDPASSLTSGSNFNHHPSFTEYKEGDTMFGKTELEQYEHMAKQGVFYCGQMEQTLSYKTRIGSNIAPPRTQNYAFRPEGGPIPEYIYELECPLTRPETKILTRSEYENWLYDNYNVGEFEFGEDAPPRNGYNHCTLFADPESGEWIDEETVNERSDA